jgi:hypothetical protein
LGAAAAPLKLTIRWTNARTEEVLVKTLDRQLTLVQDKGILPAR